MLTDFVFTTAVSFIVQRLITPIKDHLKKVLTNTEQPLQETQVETVWRTVGALFQPQQTSDGIEHSACTQSDYPWLSGSHGELFCSILVRVTMSFVLYSEWYGFHTDFRYLGDEYCNDKRWPSWGSWTIFKSTISLSSFLSDSASCAFSRRFSLECRKTNAITLTNQNTHNQNTHKQRCEPNQNSEQIYVKRFKCWKTTGLSFICNWLRTWRKFF